MGQGARKCFLFLSLQLHSILEMNLALVRVDLGPDLDSPIISYIALNKLLIFCSFSFLVCKTGIINTLYNCKG